MSEDANRFKRARRRLLAYGFGTPALIAAAALVPKDPAYASSQRLMLTVSTFAILAGGGVGFLTARRAYQDALLQLRYGPASSAVRDTLSYLRQERRLARRGQLPAVIGSLAALELFVLAHWPQVEALAPYRDAIGALALGLVTLIPLSAFHNRGSFVNTLFLKRYLRQQLEHLGYRFRKAAGRRPFARCQTEPAVTVQGEGRFTAGGFAWRFEDCAATNRMVTSDNQDG